MTCNPPINLKKDPLAYNMNFEIDPATYPFPDLLANQNTRTERYMYDNLLAEIDRNHIIPSDFKPKTANSQVRKRRRSSYGNSQGYTTGQSYESDSDASIRSRSRRHNKHR